MQGAPYGVARTGLNAVLRNELRRIRPPRMHEADAYSPPETPTIPLPAPRVPYAAALYDNIHRPKLTVETIAPFHGARTAGMAEVARQGGATLSH